MKGSIGICPQCASASVDYGQLIGSAAGCRSCKWTGVREGLVLVPFDHDFISDESIAHALMSDLKQLLAGALGVPYLRFLLKWGFLEGSSSRAAETVDRVKFTRYLMAIAKGTLVAILEERARNDAEKAKGQDG